MAGKLKNTIAGSTSLLLLLLLSLSAIRCEKEEPPVWEDFIFVIPLRMTPPDSIVRKGDTLWLTASIPDTVLEYNSKRYYRLYESPFGTVFTLNKLVNREWFLGDQPGAVSLFRFENRTGFVHHLSQSFGSITYVYRHNRYELEIGIIPSARGVFAFSMMAPSQFDLSYLTLEPAEDGRRRVPVYRGFFFVINEGQTNFSLYKAHCKPGNQASRATFFFEQKGTFTFRVI